MDKPVLSPPARWLVNIGLTLQFFVPAVVCIACLFRYHPDYDLGIPAFLLLMTLGLLLVVFTVYFVVQQWGSPRIALWFLIAFNIVHGGIWLVIATQLMNLTACVTPARLVVPAGLYLWALFLPVADASRPETIIQ